MFDREYAKVLTISFKLRVGQDRETSFTADSNTNLNGRNCAEILTFKDLLDPTKEFIDESKRLIFNVEVENQFQVEN